LAWLSGVREKILQPLLLRRAHMAPCCRFCTVGIVLANQIEDLGVSERAPCARSGISI